MMCRHPIDVLPRIASLVDAARAHVEHQCTSLTDRRWTSYELAELTLRRTAQFVEHVAELHAAYEMQVAASAERALVDQERRELVRLRGVLGRARASLREAEQHVSELRIRWS